MTTNKNGTLKITDELGDDKPADPFTPAEVDRLTRERDDAQKDSAFWNQRWKEAADQRDRYHSECEQMRTELSRVSRGMARRVVSVRADYRNAISQHDWLTLERDELQAKLDAAEDKENEE